LLRKIGGVDLTSRGLNKTAVKIGTEMVCKRLYEAARSVNVDTERYGTSLGRLPSLGARLLEWQDGSSPRRTGGTSGFAWPSTPSQPTRAVIRRGLNCAGRRWPANNLRTRSRNLVRNAG